MAGRFKRIMLEEPNLCACGCGEIVSPGKRCMVGHKTKKNNIPKKCTVEWCNKESKAHGFCARHWSHIYKYGKILNRTRSDPNEITIDGDTCFIQIYDKKHNHKCKTIIDTEDLPKIKNYKWSVIDSTNTISTRYKGAYISISRLIMDVLDQNMVVDHINHDRLDNRKINLRVCEQAKNCRNKYKQSNNKSGYKGVFWRKDTNKWSTQISVDGTTFNLGCFDSKEEAAKTYNRAAIKYHGEFASLNKIKPGKQNK
jgi:hypothetical protein